MDYPIQPIEQIEAQGRAAAAAEACPMRANPYAEGTPHSHAWQVGFLAYQLEQSMIEAEQGQ
ncbi:hypothetical protein CURE108131_25060 [Cupriavidus respiraculi]|uniref:Uncharacterized protein n=1 Tax=Cupriavidus respiraculi TaxID=195930 RepID=A0ABM8XV08_9BURK|nr:hypothetical protein [Cupriavidus respiraculi]CAG9184221.1 hypothetical protein LMG21510_05043 [Cupriavidus respiraculi]